MSGLMDAVNGAKEIAELVKKYNDVPLMQKIVELQTQIMSQTNDLVAAKTELAQLRDELSRKSAIEFRNPYFYEKGNEVPFCPKCYSSSSGGLRMPLTHPPEDFAGGNGRSCRQCKEFYREGPRKTPLPGAVVAQRRHYWE